MRIQKGALVTIKTGGEKNEWINELDEKYIFASCNENRVGETLVALRDALLVRCQLRWQEQLLFY